jgi:hypothetical protein
MHTRADGHDFVFVAGAEFFNRKAGAPMEHM